MSQLFACYSVCLLITIASSLDPHALIQKVLSDGVRLWQGFFSRWGEGGSKYHYMHYHQPGIERPFKWHFAAWCANDGLTLNAGLVALWFFKGSRPVCLDTLYFCDFSEGGSWPQVHPSGSAHDPDQVRQNCLPLMVPSSELLLENKLTDSQHARVNSFPTSGPTKCRA